MTITGITALGGLAGLIASVILLTWQTRAVAQQTKISNAIAGASVLEASTSDLREFHLLLVSRPELRPYFYGSRPAPRSTRHRNRVLSAVDILGDVLETNLVANRLIRMSESFEDWTEYCQQMLTSCPVLRCQATAHPEWWPQLARLSASMGTQT